MTVAFLPDPSTPPRVAYSVGKRVGPAVVRNRVKRRLRAIVTELVARDGDLPAGPGAYLISVTPAAAALTYPQLRRTVEQACASLAAEGRP